MPTALAPPLRLLQRPATALVACPDARPPAYQAAIALAKSERLDRFVTGFYHKRKTAALAAAERFAPEFARNLNRLLNKRRDPSIPSDRVDSIAEFDFGLAIENRLRGGSRLRRALARRRTRRFDLALRKRIARREPKVALVFSDVAGEFALPFCRDKGIPAVLGMVHGDVFEEKRLIEVEAERSPDFFSIYLADGPIDRDELAWLHDRRLRDAELADLILVPSRHIADRLIDRGTPSERVRVVPYAADSTRFRPIEKQAKTDSVSFVFAGGITQRKGIKYLLEAWRLIRRPGWRLRLLGGLPSDPAPLEPYRDEVDWLGRVPHAEVAERLAEADVFVFPSLFEGSAVVTYEALACGLPSIVTPEAGSIVRDGIEGFVVPSANVEALAVALERLGTDPALRRSLGVAARSRAERFDWPRYHAEIVGAVEDLTDPSWRTR